MNKKPQILLNERVLKLREVHLIDSLGKSLGVVNTREALKIAKEEEFDLFVVSLNTNPPVAKIIDYGHMKYEEDKKAKANQKHKQETKEVKISPRIAQHDLNTFIKRAIKFLEHGDKVKLTCVFKSREIEHPELGKEKIQLFLDSIADHGQSEGEPTLLGKLMSIMVNPKK